MNAVYNELLRMSLDVREFLPNQRRLGSVSADGLSDGYRLFAARVPTPTSTTTFAFYSSRHLFKYGIINLNEEEWYARPTGKSSVGPFNNPADAIYALCDANNAQRTQ